MYDWLDGETPLKRAEIRANAQHVLGNPTDDRQWIEFARSNRWTSWANGLVGGLVREEDSPGNYSLRPIGDRLAFVVYDAQGAEHVLGDWPLRPER